MGIVIDNAIVVMENIFRYIERKSIRPRGRHRGDAEIGLAVLAITISLVAVFLPIAMMEGIVGQFLKSFGITMAGTILVSMLVSFTLTPMLAARWLQGDSGSPPEGEREAVRAVAAPPEPAARLEGPGVLPCDRNRLSGNAPVLAPAAMGGVLGVVGCMATLPTLYRVSPRTSSRKRIRRSSR